MSEPHIAYTARPDATLETELPALAAVYRFVIDSHANKKEAAPESRPVDGTKARRIRQ